ncbi:hypothetical protein U9M48_004983 [Paspalum notatum var. saurae]|uniref:Leucine-rich repeat-containing N-terminal plant-type domain-containing protein n=1 Tax=Paspalum notatum var. saurae TaxID=547442 RepID=A0AAQ3PPU0_PASNO
MPSGMHLTTTTNHFVLLTIILAGFSFFRCGAEQPQHPHGGGGVCLPSEMAALLTFKKGITSDPANRLSSWQGEDCCRLQYLDLGNTVRSTDITVFANLPVLQHLSLSGMDLSSINDWPQKLNMIPSLRVVDLSYWWLDRADQKLPHFNLTKLEKLDLSVLDLSCSQTDYVTDLNTPEMVGNFSNLCSLQILSLGFSYAPGDMTTLIESLPQCAWGKLQELHLGHNNFTGFLPPDSIGQFTSLRILDLADNNLSGIIPPGIGNCTRLIMLLIDNNNLNGSVPT